VKINWTIRVPDHAVADERAMYEAKQRAADLRRARRRDAKRRQS